MVEPIVRGTPSMFHRHRLAPRRPSIPSVWATKPEPDQLANLALRLVALARLQANWDTYGAEPPTERAIRKALGALQSTWTNLLPETVLPSVEGGVTFVYSTDAKKYAEIEFGNDGEIMAAFRRQSEQPNAWVVRDELGLVLAVNEIRRHLGVRG